MYICIGGPYSGKKLKLVYTGTIEFKVRNFKGYYDREMNWVNTNG